MANDPFDFLNVRNANEPPTAHPKPPPLPAPRQPPSAPRSPWSLVKRKWLILGAVLLGGIILLALAFRPMEPMSESALLDFYNHPDDFKGKTLTIRCTGSIQFPKEINRDNTAMFFAPCGTKQHREVLTIVMRMPDGSRVKSIGVGEEGIVTFTCTEGCHASGNVFESMKGPYRTE